MSPNEWEEGQRKREERAQRMYDEMTNQPDATRSNADVDSPSAVREEQTWIEFDPITERYPRRDGTDIESVLCVVYRHANNIGQRIRALGYFDFLEEYWVDIYTNEPIHVTHFYEVLEPPK